MSTTGLSTTRSLLRVIPLVKGAFPKLIIGLVVGLAAAATALSIPFALRWLIDHPLTTGDSAQIIPGILFIMFLGLLEVTFNYLRRWLVLTPGVHLEGKMRNGIYQHLQRLPVAFHDKWQSGQLLSRAMSDVSTVRRWISFGFVHLTVMCLMLLTGAILLVNLSPLLGVFFLACTLPLVALSIRFQRQFTLLARLSQDQQGDLATTVEESVHGIRILKSFGRSAQSQMRFLGQASLLRQTELRKGQTNGAMWFWMLIIPDTAFALTLLLGIYLATQNQVSVGTLVAFFATAALLKGPMQWIAPMLSLSIDAGSALNRYYEVMDVPVDIADKPGATELPPGPGELVFENVHFRYEDSPERHGDLLNGINLTIKPGETMALVGVTGCGKTTLTALTTRLFEPTSGRILIDGTDISTVTLESLRAEVSMAFEDATLFSIPVKENVLLGVDGVSGTEAKTLLEESLTIAQADFVYDLPRSIETTIGEEGLNLSGGQRQRLALARAIAVRPRILVLDDPLSALDVTTEAAVEKALREVLATTTALIVAHRPSTVMLADRVALLDHGQIVDVGTHAELMERSERYRHVIATGSKEQ